ncbi:MAG: FtsW/RodA/SpoVE family cell cycle protein [Flavobacterium sp.]
MKAILQNLKGDKGIWSFVALLGLFSFMPVFSASSNLAYMNQGTGNTVSFLVKHAVHIMIGFLMIFWIHKLPYHYFKRLSIVILGIVAVLLLYTLLRGQVIDGANASRWLQIPFVGITFQTSAAASIALMIYVAGYLANYNANPQTFTTSLWQLWAPVGLIILMILPANFSTAALMFAMVLMLVYVGKYPVKYIGVIVAVGITALILFVMTAKAFPDAFPNRVDTWISRVDNYLTDKPDEDDYQIEKAKIAIASGGWYGLGPGKSVQKNFLPQSSSDFIFAIIVEEYGLLGGAAILILYLLLFFRFIVAAHKANTLFGKLVVVGLGFPIIFQALVNMCVAVELLPVTGQTLPLISSGGSSIWMTCVALGIIIGVTKKDEEIAEELSEQKRRDDTLQKLIDDQIALENAPIEEEELSYAVEDATSGNPMNAVLNKA